MDGARNRAGGRSASAVRDVFDRIRDRWSVLVLYALAEGGTLRFNALRDQIENISQRMLAQTLRRLQEDGLLCRTVHPTSPPRVDYALTPLGRSLLGPISELVSWAEENRQRVLNARKQFMPRLR